MGVALGSRPPGLAHRVLGHGGEAPRPGVRDPRRRHRPALPAPRERAGPVARRRARVRAAVGAQRHARARPGEDVQVAREHRLAARLPRRVGPRAAPAALPGRALPQPGRVLGRGDGGRQNPGRTTSAPRSGSSSGRTARRPGTTSPRRSTTTSTRRSRSRSSTRGGRRASSSCSRGAWRSSASASRRPPPLPPRPCSSPRPGRRRAPRGTTHAPTSCGPSSTRSGGRSRTFPKASG